MDLKQGGKNEHSFPDWTTYATKRKGTVIGEYQRLDHLQAPFFSHANKFSIKNTPSAIKGE